MESGQRTISFLPDGGGGLHTSIAEWARQSCPQRRICELARLTWILEFKTWSLIELGFRLLERALLIELAQCLADLPTFEHFQFSIDKNLFLRPVVATLGG